MNKNVLAFILVIGVSCFMSAQFHCAWWTLSPSPPSPIAGEREETTALHYCSCGGLRLESGSSNMVKMALYWTSHLLILEMIVHRTQTILWGKWATSPVLMGRAIVGKWGPEMGSIREKGWKQHWAASRTAQPFPPLLPGLSSYLTHLPNQAKSEAAALALLWDTSATQPLLCGTFSNLPTLPWHPETTSQLLPSFSPFPLFTFFFY